VKDENATTWLISKLLDEVKFTEGTSAMQHSVFLGLRADKKAIDVMCDGKPESSCRLRVIEQEAT
jgi:ATP-dependent DNA ligase